MPLHGPDVVSADLPDGSVYRHGVCAARRRSRAGELHGHDDDRRAVRHDDFERVRGRVRMVLSPGPGLDPGELRVYGRVSVFGPGDRVRAGQRVRDGGHGVRNSNALLQRNVPLGMVDESGPVGTVL